MSSSPIPQCSTLLPVALSASAANHGNAPINLQNEFDDDNKWNNKDLAAVDLDKAMTQLHSIGLVNPVPAVVSMPVPTPDNYTATLNSFDNPSYVTNRRSKFSDNDDDAFAQVDF